MGMRLIDADALQNVFEDLANDEWNKTTSTSWSRAFEESADIVDGCKTVEERNRGKWMFSPDDAEAVCTVCQYKIYGRSYQGRYLIVPYNFCPNCGADMRGESNE